MPVSYKTISKLCLFLGAGLAISAPIAAAQNTGGVSGPVVNAGDMSAEYRLAYVPGDGGADDRFAQRLHGRVSLDHRRAARVVVQGSDRGGLDGFEWDFVQAELFMELSDEQATQWNSGVRLDARLSRDGLPDQLGANWLNQFRLSDRLSARANLHSTLQLGDNAADGLLLQARGSLTYQLDGPYSLSVLSFHSLGSTEDFGITNRAQQLGPVISGKLDGGWTWTVGNLFGLNSSTPDNDIRFWFGRSF